MELLCVPSPAHQESQGPIKELEKEVDECAKVCFCVACLGMV